MTRRDWCAELGVNFSGGSWQTPYSTLLNIRPQVVLQARSSEPDATTFTVDLGDQRNNIGLFHFQRLNITPLATMRLVAGNDPTFTGNVYDTGVVSGWPLDKTPLTNSQWGQFVINGTYEPEEYAAFGYPRYFIPSSPIAARYILVQIFDPTATVPAQIGCFGACETWSPTQIDFGWSITWIDESDVQTVPYGSRYIIPRGKRRKLNIGMSSLSEQDLMSVVMGWVGMIGKSRPVVIAMFPDGQNLEKRCIYGTLTDDVQISNPYFARYQVPLTLEQLI